jgi:diaminohydroxyphosphoribosylaminopyrimidine deaminase/5-amino-6-(5-phosphoribosylamino)uracil reductase
MINTQVLPSDEPFLRRALELAQAGVGLTSPNPSVGAVIVRDGQIVGSGSHTYAGIKHAEVLALEQAGSRARGGTLYLNLEPCSHQGRTGPCADTLLAAGIRRVVCSMEDPNPLVAGRGFEQLRAAGVAVEVGGLAAEARRLNEAFAHFIRHKTPLVTLKAAMTLDGKIAPPAVGSAPPTGWITGEAARAHAQTLRHASDAVLVGVGTVLADNPLLTDRSGLPRRRPLLRIILDSHLRLPLASRLVQTAREDVLVFSLSPDPERRKSLESRGVRVETMTAGTVDSRPDFAGILRRLGEMEITSLLIEGGALINGSALAAGIVDKAFLYFAPRILGSSAIPFLLGASFTHPPQAPYLHHLRLQRFGEDFAVEGYFRDPYGK